MHTVCELKTTLQIPVVGDIPLKPLIRLEHQHSFYITPHTSTYT